MRTLTVTTSILAALFFAGIVISYAGAVPEPKGGPGSVDCPNFVDEDNDGINDNCPNDGTRAQDGTGAKRGTGKVNRGAGPVENCPNFIDEDGDGINDNCPYKGERQQDGTGKRRMGRIRSNPDGGTEAPGTQDKIRDRARDGSCDGKARKTRRVIRGHS